MELYHDNNDIHALQPNDVTRRHLHITHSPTVFVDSMTEVPSPISKALFSTEPENQPALLDFLRAQPWYDRYEIVASSSSLVELTAKGANKGGMVRRLAELLGIRQENVACVRGPRQRHLHAELGGYGLRPPPTRCPRCWPCPRCTSCRTAATTPSPP